MRLLHSLFFVLLLFLTSCIPGITVPNVLEASADTGVVVNIVSGTLEVVTDLNLDTTSWLLVSDELFSANGQEATEVEPGYYELSSSATSLILSGKVLSFSLQFREKGETTEYYIDYPDCLKLATCKSDG